jgi:hypothetical protein
MKHHQPPIPTDLRRQESRARATALADQLLRSDAARRARMTANDLKFSNVNSTKRQARAPDSRLPTPLRLSDLAQLHPLAPCGSRGR